MSNNKMMKLAKLRHSGQFRNARPGEKPVPYFKHPEAVVKNLFDWGEPETSAAISIAWGHDLLEETTATEQEILDASDETVLEAIRVLTFRKGLKSRYLRNVARSGDRNILLVKISDRIQNSRDFISYSGRQSALEYLHKADCIYTAVRKLPSDPVLEKAVAAWQELDQSLQNPD